MSIGRASLLAGRRSAPLSEDDVRKVMNIFLGLDRYAPFKHEVGARTCLRTFNEDGEEVAEIVFGADIFPGVSMVDPNSSLGVKAAACHELTHHQRWINKTQLDEDNLVHIDEAMTSLEAILRFQSKLSEHEFCELVRDALQRLALYVQELRKRAT